MGFKKRKARVDEEFEKERLAQQRKKEQLKMQQQNNNNQNFIFNNFGPMFRGGNKGPVRDVNDEVDVDTEQFNLWNEIENKMNDLKLDSGMPTWKKGTCKPATQWWSGLDSKSFFQLLFYVCTL